AERRINWAASRPCIRNLPRSDNKRDASGHDFQLWPKTRQQCIRGSIPRSPRHVSGHAFRCRPDNVSGYDFSRAENVLPLLGFSPCGFSRAKVSGTKRVLLWRVCQTCLYRVLVYVFAMVQEALSIKDANFRKTALPNFILNPKLLLRPIR